MPKRFRNIPVTSLTQRPATFVVSLNVIVMRFIAVFKQHQMARSLGFDSLVDALDFLFWGYEDQELTPQGVYDQVTDSATLYDHAGQFVDGLSLESVRVIAKEYLNTFKPLSNLIRLSDG